MSKVRYDYRHPVFYSRKHPFAALDLALENRLALYDHMVQDENAPF
jgi:hypothetical protein